MNNKTEFKVYIKIHEFDCSIEEITNLIGINPTKAWLKGDVIPNRKGNIKRGISSWILQSALSTDNKIEDHIDYLLNIVKSNYEVFKKLLQKYNGELTIVIYSYVENNLGFTLAADKLKDFINIGFTLDVDIYYLK